MLETGQSAFFEFCAGNRHHIVAGARVTAVNVTPKLLVTRVEVAKVAQLIGLSCKCGTNYTLCCGLARVRVESDTIVPKIRLSLLHAFFFIRNRFIRNLHVEGRNI